MTWSFSRGEKRIAPAAALGLLSILVVPLALHCYDLLAHDNMQRLYGLASKANTTFEADEYYRQALAFPPQDCSRDTLYAAIERALGTDSAANGWGNSAENELLIKNAIEIDTRVYGEVHPETATSIHCLGATYLWTYRLKEAEQLLLKALRIRRLVNGPEAFETMITMHRLATVYEQENRIEDAAPLMDKAYKLERKFLGRDNEQTEDSRFRLRRLLRTLHKYDQAEPLFEESLESNKHLNPATLFTASTANELGTFYAEEGKDDKALAAYKEALNLLHKENTIVWPQFAEGAFCNNLAKSLLKLHRYEEAEHYFKWAVTVRKFDFGERNDVTLDSQFGLALTYKSKKLYKDAEPILENIIQCKRQKLKSKSPYQLQNAEQIKDLSKASEALAEIYHLTGRKSEANALEQATAQAIWQSHSQNCEALP